MCCLAEHQSDAEGVQMMTTRLEIEPQPCSMTILLMGDCRTYYIDEQLSPLVVDCTPQVSTYGSHKIK